MSVDEVNTWYFSPRANRFFSILSRENPKQAHCVKHDMAMEKKRPIIHHDGAMYRTGDDHAIYSCLGCFAQLADEVGEERAIAVFRAMALRRLKAWMDGETDADLFENVEEVGGDE